MCHRVNGTVNVVFHRLACAEYAVKQTRADLRSSGSFSHRYADQLNLRWNASRLLK